MLLLAAEACPEFHVEVRSITSSQDFEVIRQNSGSTDDPNNALFGSGSVYNVIANDVLEFKLSLSKWGGALFDVRQICLTTNGIESLRILGKDAGGRNILRENVCTMLPYSNTPVALNRINNKLPFYSEISL